MLALIILTGLLTGASSSDSVVNASTGGDGDYPHRHHGVKPLPRFKPKTETALDEAMILIEEVSTENRVTENKKIIKASLAIINDVEVAETYKEPLASIKKRIVNFSRHAAKHEGLMETSSSIAQDIDNLVGKMQSRHKRQKKEEEQIAIWLSNMISTQFQQLE